MSSVIPNVNMAELLGAPDTNPEPKSDIETALEKVDPADAAATSMEEVKFQFRDLISEQQKSDLKKNAPLVARKMISDYNAIVQFGEPVLQKLNDGSIQLLNAQRQVEIPAADEIVNNLLRTMDGYSAKYRNEKMEGVIGGIRKFFQTGAYNIKAMIRDAEPIVEKLAIAEKELRSMELKLGDNVSRGQELHRITTNTLREVVSVLAALEEIIDVARADFNEIDSLIKEAEAKQKNGEGLVTLEYKGEMISLQELKDLHVHYANGVSELEKSWFDWRQQFFIGYATAPAIMNIILVSTTMQRRCQVLRTMGLPTARRSLAMWQQAAVAKENAEKGQAISDGLNKLIQDSFEAAGAAVVETAKASQAPVITEETIFSVIESIEVQCKGLVEADRWGREQRAKNLRVLEAGEVGINQTFTESRRALVANAVSTARQELDAAPAPDADVLKQLGVKA